MYAEAHWNKVFSTKAPDAVSWYRPHLEVSLDLIERRAPAKSGSIIDVGAGELTLVDDLLARGYREITILDVSKTAIEITKERLGPAAKQANGFGMCCRCYGTAEGKETGPSAGLIRSAIREIGLTNESGRPTRFANEG